MRPYEHGGDIYRNRVRLDFSVNTNPLGIPESVIKALGERLGACANYPDPHCEALCCAIARFEGVPQSHIICGNGAADLIYRLVFSQKPKQALVCAPTFSEYERAVLISGGVVKYHTLREVEGFALTRRILDEISIGTDMVFVCNPNNPTGKLADGALLQAIAERCLACGATLVVDECFLPFTSGKSLKTLPQVVVLKAFTKLYAMAGLRLGYLLCGNADITNAVWDHAQTWSVSALAQIAGVAALEQSGDWVKQTLDVIQTERESLCAQLRALGLRVWESDANFILLRSERPLYGPLLKRGILVRCCANFKGLGENDIRIAVKLRAENQALVATIKQALAGEG